MQICRELARTYYVYICCNHRLDKLAIMMLKVIVSKCDTLMKGQCLKCITLYYLTGLMLHLAKAKYPGVILSPIGWLTSLSLNRNTVVNLFQGKKKKRKEIIQYIRKRIRPSQVWFILRYIFLYVPRFHVHLFIQYRNHESVMLFLRYRSVAMKKLLSCEQIRFRTVPKIAAEVSF